jgi:hypothetical protein
VRETGADFERYWKRLQCAPIDPLALRAIRPHWISVKKKQYVAVVFGDGSST